MRSNNLKTLLQPAGALARVQAEQFRCVVTASQLNKYLANCPKPPVSAFECVQTLCAPLDLSATTQLLELQVQRLEAEVTRYASYVQLKDSSVLEANEASYKEEEQQHKLLRLQEERQMFLRRRNPKEFSPISNWSCPGVGKVLQMLFERA